MEQWQRKRDILAMLSTQEFVSGEALAERLGISRAAISKHIDVLETLGLSIYSVKGRGYKLATPVSLIDEQRLKQGIERRCFYFDDIPSTNAFMLSHSEELESGDVCIAEHQSAGRGRRGRRWVSPYGSHLYFSLFWRLTDGMSKAMGLSLVVGCSLAKVLDELGVEGIGLKWPNDVYLDGRKLAGILVEMKGQADSNCELIIGIGVNMAMPEAQGETIDQPWADLQAHSMPDKTEFAVLLQRQLQADLSLFEREGLGAFVERWQVSDLFIGKPVNLMMADRVETGICRGIDEQGALLLELAGGVKSFVGGEISLRPA
ncbi:bifunctional biotin--[acetyl-CoA-carboxylase] ligase/biotin operon repressor BirA [Shewanella litorisediminis]|uniref:Bifunctional ligase/repressor BirA n=1 Tax=Shewanella litorisediminis TaxID=1173586 RepID=A0ABX7G453_9GAMM|nr:bifunctional biotin--[acetyl-CoA-carboxylase] ligase/biotin operon repressor BirA [Shewanella litorisediminis]MCL2920097.1 bifunctional biotin--[acetyl-CoA-carboxylase] ligase/biotin operon repressor BirA [Shewanella litorisediminis]QRH02032.1 bifunctional biotin--[acetyl-CoA-carboxylase] ligase/biotin operon repressor BirA [Shewanella litorisediminis]